MKPKKMTLAEKEKAVRSGVEQIWQSHQQLCEHNASVLPYFSHVDDVWPRCARKELAPPQWLKDALTKWAQTLRIEESLELAQWSVPDKPRSLAGQKDHEKNLLVVTETFWLFSQFERFFANQDVHLTGNNAAEVTAEKLGLKSRTTVERRIAKAREYAKAAEVFWLNFLADLSR